MLFISATRYRQSSAVGRGVMLRLRLGQRTHAAAVFPFGTLRPARPTSQFQSSKVGEGEAPAEPSQCMKGRAQQELRPPVRFFLSPDFQVLSLPLAPRRAYHGFVAEVARLPTFGVLAVPNPHEFDSGFSCVPARCVLAGSAGSSRRPVLHSRFLAMPAAATSPCTSPGVMTRHGHRHPRENCRFGCRSYRPGDCPVRPVSGLRCARVRAGRRGKPRSRVGTRDHVQPVRPVPIDAGTGCIDGPRSLLATATRRNALTGRLWAEPYLVPLSQTDLLADSIRTHTQVVAISRDGPIDANDAASQDHEDAHLRVLLRGADGHEHSATPTW